jgi:hypothetical protein
MITVKFNGLDKMLRDLQKFRTKAVPYALRDAVNSAAFEVRREWQGVIRKTLTNRNQFTERSIRVDQTRSLDTRHMVAVVGSVAPFMRKLEEGSTRFGKSQQKPIPTAVAAGLPQGSKRTKMVRASARLRAIVAVRGASGRTRMQRNAIALAVARKKRQKFALLERKGGGRALFEVRRRLAPKMLWDLSRGSVHVPAHETLQPALKRVEPRLEAIAHAALLKQLKRHRIAGY